LIIIDIFVIFFNKTPKIVLRQIAVCRGRFFKKIGRNVQAGDVMTLKF